MLLRILSFSVMLLASAPAGASYTPILPGHVAARLQRGSPRAARSSTIGDLTLTGVFPRIFTPNGDGFNDKVQFNFNNPEALPVSGEIFDLPGSRVAGLSLGRDPTSQLLWDGRDSDGRTVPGGMYLYQIDFQGKFLTGTVVVAR